MNWFIQVCQWTWFNKVNIANRVSSMFWVVYSVVLPYFSTIEALPSPWNKIVPAVAAVLTFYGFGNSAPVQIAKSAVARMFKRT